MELILFFLLGALISVLSGFFGIGGGFILTPLLMLLGLAPIEAIATSLLFTIGSSSSGIIGHIKLKNIHWKAGVIIGVSGIVATQIAHPFVVFLDAYQLDEWAIPAMYIVLLSFFSVQMFKKKSAQQVTNHEVQPSILKMVLIGLFAGFVSTSLGVGGGFIIVPMSIAFLGMLPKKAVGTSLFAVLFIVSAGFLSYAFTVEINYFMGIFLLAGGLIGSQFGARSTDVFDNKEITTLLAFLYLTTILSVALKAFEQNVFGLIIVILYLLYFFTVLGKRHITHWREEKGYS
ncbi:MULTISPECIES: sulfite exporter TauE/SafE family protein [Cytobacillus]|uniref:Probable membrane transporter protein n=1 Tax=Cytobacillus stercorigallinarum TaxID=2762240 RepID=A0ABR8QPB2_9BACI|nr:sulfite exporter TauE/SafE family protein [Cytobacillus stercorigallinarum]MBD7937380.1 sulfite exporter TauE/SafE family protein [Cytobacillus stercorigallinarum]